LALPHLDFMKNVYDRLASYFSHEHMRISTSFQAKYLGMSPWHCPATFTILPYIEHKWGVFHPIGGLNEISRVMARIFAEEGGRIHLSSPVEQILIEKNKAVGVRLQDQREIRSDSVIINADFAHAMSNLVPEQHRPKYTDTKLGQKEYSCSTFMIYLGLDKLYPIPHHNVIFAKDYHQNIREIIDSKVLSSDPSYYLQNASVTDPTLAPAGKSTLYVLVPVPNNSSGIDWQQQRQPFRDRIIAAICRNPELSDLAEHIEVEKIITPADWEQEYNVYQGAVFNLSHTIFQMLYLRPRNRFEEFGSCYLVGGGTHPGSGLPTIYQSGRISGDLLCKDFPPTD
jgi:phytoene desaturase